MQLKALHASEGFGLLEVVIARKEAHGLVMSCGAVGSLRWGRWGKMGLGLEDASNFGFQHGIQVLEGTYQ